MVSCLKNGGTFLLNTTFSAEELQDHLPNRMLAQLAKKNAKFYIIDATKIAQEIGMGRPDQHNPAVGVLRAERTDHAV